MKQHSVINQWLNDVSSHKIRDFFEKKVIFKKSICKIIFQK